jgi:hypothetical protein
VTGVVRDDRIGSSGFPIYAKIEFIMFFLYCDIQEINFVVQFFSDGEFYAGRSIIGGIKNFLYICDGTVVYNQNVIKVSEVT